MPEWIFLTLLFLVCTGYLIWGFKTLPGEDRQMLAVLPVRKREDGSWDGLNITWYGLLTANAVVAAAALFILLTGSLGWNTRQGFLLIGWILILALPCARVIARWVEKKDNTFTTGGAFVIGLAAAWPGVILINQTFGGGTTALDPMTTLAALMIAYVFGEGLGRLACISFGCCYGRRVADCHAWMHAALRKFHFVFEGKTKKIAYAQGWDGVPVVPIQGVTALVLVITGLSSLALFLHGSMSAAFLLALILSQGWRIVSEFWRWDHRGAGALTFYQKLCMAAIAYGLALTLWLPATPEVPLDLSEGFQIFAQSASLLFLDGLWFVTLFYMGRSRVTASSVRFHILHNRI